MLLLQKNLFSIISAYRDVVRFVDISRCGALLAHVRRAANGDHGETNSNGENGRWAKTRVVPNTRRPRYSIHSRIVDRHQGRVENTLAEPRNAYLKEAQEVFS